MGWNRRQPRWPLWVLGCTFALTVSAPTWWSLNRREPAVSVESTAAQVAPAPREAPIAPPLAPAAPTLPPLAVERPQLDVPMTGPAQLAAPSLEGAVVESDDYVVVDEPLIEPTPVVELPAPVAEPAIVDAAPSAVAESFAQRSVEPIVIAAPAGPIPVPAPEPPSVPAFTLTALTRARTALTTLMDEAQQYSDEIGQRAAALAESLAAPARTDWAPAAPALAPPTAAPVMMPPRVIVSSEHDRLAMIPDLAAPAPAPVLEVMPQLAPMPEMAPTLEPEPLAPEHRLAAVPKPEAAPAPAAIPAALRHAPTALIHDLEALIPATPAAAWAQRVLATLDELTSQPTSAATVAAVEELRRLASVGFNDALAVANAGQQSAWIRAARALDRRLPVWTLLADGVALRELDARRADPEANEPALMQALNGVAALTASAEAGAGWRTYLRLDDLAGLASVGGSAYRDERRAAAREALVRIASPRLTAAQREFLTQPPLAALAQELRPWASGEISLDALSALVERYEASGSLNDAEAIAELRLRMKWSGDARLESLADDLNRNYRNANLRVALSANIFNRMLPPQPAVEAPVRERIGNADVRGRSLTETHTSIRLIPDATVWRLGLEVNGTVSSRTYSDVGPARVRNVCRMDYELTKQIMLNSQGMQISPAEAEVQGRNTLAGVESTFDPVPIVGSIVEDVIRRRHRESQGAAIAQVKAKVKRQARERMDREADAGLHEFEARLATNLLGPLGRFNLAAEPVDMSTTEERAVMRLRLAGEQHLGAHTPRPTAPSDSVASLQIHQSALNNAIRALDLDGRRLTVGELHALLGEKFSGRPPAPPADLPQRAIVEFTKRDAVRVACDGDRVELTLGIVEMRKGRDSIKNVRVHAFFVPVVEGIEVKLVRDGGLQFEGAHLRSGTRLVLHSVFGKLLQRDQEIPLLAARLSEDPRLAGLMVTQLVIDDGWVALSVGPSTAQRTAWRTRGAANR
jgi:hypothetical protein